ncbi:MAG TPA: multiheme c-type cytochrome, partial [Myxococcota bacterium]|nr:multiheme c-type cytochrome [Myxococcota bacterium]
MLRRFCLWATLLCAVACAEAPVAPITKIPKDEGPFYPSLAQVQGDFDPAAMDDVASCLECHPDAVHQWQSSAHANASFGNPWYRTLVDDLREKQGFTASRHCGGCHDPLLLLSGRMDQAIEPGEGQALSGVTCLVCHSVSKATVDGNGSYVLDSSPVPYPEVGEEDSIASHRARLAMDPLRTPALCASCHRGFLGPHTGSPEVLGGIDEPGQWRASAWAGSHAARLEPELLPKRECRSCHMPEVEAKE